MNSSVRALVEEYSSRIEDNRIFFAPDLPPDKVENALNSYATIAKDEEILALIDDTNLGSAKKGVLLTDKSVYTHRMMQSPKSIRLDDIQSITFKKGLISCSIRINDAEFAECQVPDQQAMRLFAEMLERLSEAVAASSISEQPTRLQWVFKGELPHKPYRNSESKNTGLPTYCSPVLAVFRDTLQMVRRDRYGQLLRCRFGDSEWWDETAIGKQKSDTTPALATVGDVLHMVHTGRMGQSIWHSTYDGLFWSDNVKIPNFAGNCRPTPFISPALATVGDALHLTYVGVKYKGQQTLWHATFDGQEWSTSKQLLDKDSELPPSLAVYNGILHMLHVSGPLNTIWHSTFDGQEWSTSTKVLDQKSDHSPVLTAFGGVLHMLHKDPQGHLYHSTYGGQRWSSSERLESIEKCAWTSPAVVAGRDCLHMVFYMDVGSFLPTTKLVYFQGVVH